MRVSSGPRSAQNDIKRARSSMTRVGVADRCYTASMSGRSQPIPYSSPDKAAAMRYGIARRFARDHKQHSNTVCNGTLQCHIERMMGASEIMPVQIDAAIRRDHTFAKTTIPAAIQMFAGGFG